MKRKRGKRGNFKKDQLSGSAEISNVGSNMEEDSVEDECENDDVDSGSEVETPPSTVHNEPEKLPIASPTPQMDTSSGGQMDNKVVKAVYSRVRVKIKSSKPVEPQPASSEPQAHSEADKSSLQVSLDKRGVGEKMEDSANSLPENNLTSENPPKKFGGIRIKSSHGLSSSTLSPCTNNESGEGDIKQEKDSEVKNARYNKQELVAAIEVIKKVMKMDAAEPFNAPVDPVALGIPDYFDVIDTPMDFGTICSNLEKGIKYVNSEEVYKDVRFIWENCYKYNNKGDFIVGLMKRVKKNFMNLWITAGLYIELPQGFEGNTKDATQSSDGTTPEKGVLASQLTKKFSGLKKHKDGCLCAICVMMRRRQEREEIARLLEDPTDSDDYDEETKTQGTSPFPSPGGEYTSSNMDNSPDLGPNTYVGGNQHAQGNDHEMMIQRKGDGEDRRNDSDHARLLKPKVKLDKRQKAKMLENLRYMENSMLFDLSRTLFPDGKKSVWNGPHSLVQRGTSARSSAIQAALSSFMK